MEDDANKWADRWSERKMQAWGLSSPGCVLCMWAAGLRAASTYQETEAEGLSACTVMARGLDWHQL
jgi:hypothetical protein